MSYIKIANTSMMDFERKLVGDGSITETPEGTLVLQASSSSSNRAFIGFNIPIETGATYRLRVKYRILDSGSTSDNFPTMAVDHSIVVNEVELKSGNWVEQDLFYTVPHYVSADPSITSNAFLRTYSVYIGVLSGSSGQIEIATADLYIKNGIYPVVRSPAKALIRFGGGTNPYVWDGYANHGIESITRTGVGTYDIQMNSVFGDMGPGEWQRDDYAPLMFGTPWKNTTASARKLNISFGSYDRTTGIIEMVAYDIVSGANVELSGLSGTGNYWNIMAIA